MDELDTKILAVVQRDASLSVADVADQVGLSQTACWKRLKRLEAAGTVRRRVALLAADKLKLGLVGFVHIKAPEHSEAWVDRFANVVSRMPEIVECHRMTGEIDYLLKVVAPDMAGYDAIYKRLINAIDMSDVSVSFSMERLKETTELPLAYAD